MHQFFICNPDEVESKLRTLIKTGASEDGWTQFYQDNSTGERWLYTVFESEYQGGGQPVLKRLPGPTIDELIEIAMTSTDTNNIVGASLELSERESHNKEDFRQKLLDRLLQVNTSRLSSLEKERLKIIIYESDLYDATNRREIVGKHLSEIQQDAEYYRTIAQRAKNILASIDQYSS